jgi:hypothetical protein
MSTAKLPAGITELLSEYPANVQQLAMALRQHLLGALPGAQEKIDVKAKLIGYGFGAGYRNLICTIIPSRSGIKLGFFGGAALPDPTHLLEGKGKLHRHVSMKTAQDLERPGLAALLEAGVAAWRDRVR